MEYPADFGLLKIKYSIPAADKRLVSRFSVNGRLEEALSRRLTVITAPAGCGKTSAVLKWMQTVSLPAAWFSIDDGDNDAAAFWRYFCAALDAVRPGVSHDTEYVLLSSELQNAHIHINILIDMLNEVETDFLFVLDDLHLITDPSILQELSYLIDYLPARMHLVFISRTEPKLNMARHKIKWQTHILNENDLRFDETDILNFFRARGYALEDDDLKKVESYTEGWAAALVAVAMSMEREGGSTHAIAALPRSSRDIEQYLKDEVIDAWSPERRAFAMKTSILETLTPSLCAAVTGDLRGEEMIEDISKASGFLVMTDEQKQEYRYHNLFKSFLIKLLLEKTPEEATQLHLKAGLWHREMGLLPEAIEHLLLGGFYHEAFELIEHEVDHLINKNDFGRLLSWIQRLPEEYRDHSFKIAVIYAVYYAEMGQYDLSRQWVGRMKALKEDYPYAADAEWSNYSSTLSTMVEVNLFVREGNMDYVSLLFSIAETDGGKYYKMPDYNDFNVSDIYFCRCPIYKVTDLFKESADKYNRVVQKYRGLISKNPGYAPLCIGEYLYEYNRMEEVLPYLLKAQEEARQANCPGALVPAMVGIARMKRAGGELGGAFAVLEECEKLLAGSGKPHWNYLLRAFRCRLNLDAGNTAEVNEWLLRSKLNTFMEISRIREFELIVYARVLMAQGRAQDAELLLQRLLTFTGDEHRLHSRVEVLNLLALLAYGKNQLRIAFKYMDESLDIGREEGYGRSYLDELLPMARLLRVYIKSRRTQSEEALPEKRKAFAAALLKQMPDSLLETKAYKDLNAERSAEGLEHLTEQEKRVLILLANAATNLEICDRLEIGLRTVKTHTGNIYSKLGLKNRTQCIKLVHELGLL